MKGILLIVVLAISTIAFSQPPAADMANKEQEPYIDTLIDVSNFDLAFNLLRDSILQNFATENILDKDAIDNLKNKIQYDYSRFQGSAYNCFARKPVDELEQLISKYRKFDIQRLSPELKYLGRALLGNMENWIKYCIKEYVSELK